MNHASPRTARLATAVTLTFTASACSVSFDDGQVSFVDEDAQLFCAEGNSVTLAAQSVPSADHIPCIAELPSGWSADYTDFAHDGVEIGLDSRRAPIDDMVFHFNATCDPGELPIADPDNTLGVPEGATATQDLDDLDFRIVIADSGYCAELIASLDVAEEVAATDFPTINWISRAAIDAGVAESTDDRLRLDP